MSEASSISLSWPQDDVALLTFNLPDKSANLLSSAVLAELAAHLDALEQRADLAGLIVRSGKPGTFIAGADLREFVASVDKPYGEIVALCRRGQTLFQRLSQLPCVSVAAIDGVCVGGGAELAVWCDRRVVSDNPQTEIGFPEVKLGLFPGWGGTVRAPRIIGLANAVELITGGDSVDAPRALALGLADEIAPDSQLLTAALGMVVQEQVTREYLADRRRWAGPLALSETELGFLGVTASAMIRQKTKDQYPAPAAALESLLETSQLDADAALLREAEAMARLFGSPVNRALLNVFFLTDHNKKDAGVAVQAAGRVEKQGGEKHAGEKRGVAQLGVVGAGIMGSGIAAAALRRELTVVLADAQESALRRGAEQALEEAAYERAAKGPSVARLTQLAPRLNLAQGDHAFTNCDLLIEAVVENAEVKRKLYERLETQLRPGAILASNTSTIPIGKLAAGLKAPDRFCGIHFFNPVRRMKLVEVIRGPQTSDATVAAAVAFAKQIGKMPIVVSDGPGFLVNRLLFPFMNEALQLATEGATPAEIERAAKVFGMPMGPLALYDMVGLDTSMYAGRTMWEAFPDRIVASPLLPALVKAGRLGQKSGAGFFSYRNRQRQAEADPELEPFLAAYRRDEPRRISREEITQRLILPMLLEATRLLADQIARDVRDIDIGVIFGLGFPPFRGGLLYWADTVGADKIVAQLEQLAPHGQRFQPTPLLLELAGRGGKFYDL